MNINTKHTTLLEKSEKNIISLNALKTYIRVDFDEEDNLLSSFIKSAQEEVENIIGKNLLPQKWKQDVIICYDNYDEDFRFELPAISDSVIRVSLTKKPVIATHCINVDGTIIDSDYYAVMTNADIPVLCIRSKALIGLAKSKNVSVGITYSTGTYSDMNSIPEKIKLGILMIAANKYFQRNIIYDEIGRTKQYAGIKRLLAEFRSYNMN